MTKSELVRDAAMTALGVEIATIGIKNGSKVLFGSAVISAVTILTVDILIAVREKKNREK